MIVTDPRRPPVTVFRCGAGPPRRAPARLGRPGARGRPGAGPRACTRPRGPGHHGLVMNELAFPSMGTTVRLLADAPLEPLRAGSRRSPRG